jgi:hypothetical protein
MDTLDPTPQNMTFPTDLYVKRLILAALMTGIPAQVPVATDVICGENASIFCGDREQKYIVVDHKVTS